MKTTFKYRVLVTEGMLASRYQLLDELGSEGWQLVAVVPQSGRCHYYFMLAECPTCDKINQFISEKLGDK